MFAVLLVVGYVATVWCVALAFQNTRNARFLAGLLLLSVIFLAAGLVPGLTAVARLAVVAVTTAMLVGPEWFGIASVSRDDRKFVRTVRSTAGQPAGHAEAAAASNKIRSLLGATTLDDSPLQVTALRLLEQASLQESGTLRNGTLVLPVQAPLFRASARAYIAEIGRGRTLGTHTALRPWHEDYAIRGYLAAFRDLIPLDALRPGPVALGDWVATAATVLDQLAALPIHDSRLIGIRRDLHSLLRIELEIRTGNRSTETDAQYEATQERLDAQWRTVLTELQAEANPSIDI